MTWITTCAAPNLDHLFTPVIANYLLNMVFINRGGHTNPQVRSYIHSFILGTDKALRAYNLGRGLLLEYAESDNRSVVLLHGLSEFETCITTVKRCLSLADRMATHPENPEIERTVRRLLDSYERTVRPIRDAIEHMDEDIARGEIQPGDPLILSVSQDGEFLEIGQHQLRFGDLANCLSQLHSVAIGLASRDRSV
jgi:hypothetical protein